MRTKLTELRKEIVSLIENAETPLNARKVRGRMSSQPNLSTVYRALEFLDANDYVSSVSFSGVRFYYTGEHPGHGHFLFCRECHNIQEFDECVVIPLQRRIQEKFDFQVTGHVLYFEGLCADCRRYLEKKSHSLI